jgi:hypothetical protein
VKGSGEAIATMAPASRPAIAAPASLICCTAAGSNSLSEVAVIWTTQMSPSMRSRISTPAKAASRSESSFLAWASSGSTTPSARDRNNWLAPCSSSLPLNMVSWVGASAIETMTRANRVGSCAGDELEN